VGGARASAAGGAPARAVFAVLDADVYIPTQWNAPARTDPQWSAPTSYYAAVQAVGRAAVVDDPAELAALLTRQMGQMQPEGGHAPVAPGPTPFGRMLAGIRGLRLEIEEVRAKFKFGGNRTAAHQGDVAARLAERDGPGDRAARAHLLRRAAGAPERAAASAGCPASAHGVADSPSATGATPAARCPSRRDLVTWGSGHRAGGAPRHVSALRASAERDGAPIRRADHAVRIGLRQRGRPSTCRASIRIRPGRRPTSGRF
jgi:hypothetical protein